MVEHVGHEYMDEFFSSCEYHLAKDGLFVLQVRAIIHHKKKPISIVHPFNYFAD